MSWSKLFENPLKANPAGQEYRVKVHVGPVDVPHYERKMRKLGSFSNVTGGTEHIYGTVSFLTDDPAAQADRIKIGTAWALFGSTSPETLRSITVTKR